MIDIEDLLPPEPRFTPELEWVLQAAFKADRSPPTDELAPTEAWDRARDLALTERIGARQDATTLPPELSNNFRKAQARSAAVNLLYERAARELAEVAARLETPVVFLKGMALSLSGFVPVGARSFSDLDVLVPEERAEALFQELVGREFTPSPAESTEQHLPELRPPRGGSIEVHFVLRGLEIADHRPASFEDLAERDSFTRLEDFPGSSFLPSRFLLATHLLVHGFQQHLLRPTTYPLFRMIADLIDILPGTVEWSDLESGWHPFIQHAVTARSFEATHLLCDHLLLGERPHPQDEPDATRLFHHLLAGSLDRKYAESLRGPYLRERLSEAYRRGELSSYLRRKIRPLFGRPRVSRPS